MTDCAIRVENLSKRYRIGSRERYKTLRESLTSAFTVPFRRLRGDPQSGVSGNSSSALRAPGTSFRSPTDDFIWALQDLSFEVPRGEALGIIGRNGAGKSTLLKVLSRITRPTRGRVEVRGRIGSLLEVGTGFHPELTGRENIYLNGAILGMRKAEIDRKFDDIVTFAEIEKFIDTPVKRYSSGMYVRLAFAVAAHLDPEILLVDEVLAVGDAEFQRKCLGRMKDVIGGGRTIFFVSHNLQAIQSLCSSAIRLDAGRLVAQGAPRDVVSEYLSSLERMTSAISWPHTTAPGNNDLRLLSVQAHSSSGDTGGTYSSQHAVYIDLNFHARTTHSALCVGFDLLTTGASVVLRSYQTDMSSGCWPMVRLGENRWRCTIPAGLLNAGIYYVCPRIGLHNIAWLVHLDATVQFEIMLDHGVSPFWNVLTAQNRPGMIAPILEWRGLQND